MAKANFDHIYTADDPRPYFETLGELDYQIPAHGAGVFSAIAGQIAEARDIDTVTVTDLCCSYGINAALMKYDPSYAEVVNHYTADECQTLERDELLARDRSFFSTPTAGQPLEVIGIDASAEAIAYAIEAGLLDDGAAEDLETRDPSPELAEILESTDLVTITGGIGYITERTVGRVLDATPTTPWLAALCLRWVDFDAIAEAGRARDMVVHRLEGVTYPQRRFMDSAEQSFVMSELDRRGIDTADHEADGYHHAELFVLQPSKEALTRPLHDLVSATV